MISDVCVLRNIMIVNDELIKITNTYPTPVYVFDENEVAERAKQIKGIMKNCRLCYSIKANPFLIPALSLIVDYFEVCSPGELAICKNLKVSPEKIIYSGVHKDLSDTTEAIEYGVAIITAESLIHMEHIRDAANRLNRHVDAILRLTSGTQFGMSLDDINKILSEPDPSVNIIGLHYFAGTGRKQNKKRVEELEMLTDTIEKLRNEYNLELPMLEYGPGLPYPYFTDEDHSDTLAPMRELAPYLEKTSAICRLSVEMGRFIASSCGYYMTSVCDIKRSNDTNWCIIDGGINHVNYLGQMMGMKVPVIFHFRDGVLLDDTGGDNYTVCGSLCTTNDILIRSVGFDDLRIGDVLVFSNIGAYSVTESMGLFLSRSLPRVVMYQNGNATLARDLTETWRINSQDIR